MDVLKEFLPLFIPLIIAQFVLFGFTLYHILTHRSYKRGNRTIWLVVTIVCMNFVGPIIYWVFGRDDGAKEDERDGEQADG